jgi:hypothetical protein
MEGYAQAPGVTIQYNVFANWGGTNIVDICHVVHDNLFVDINNSNDGSTHSDVMFCFGEYAGGAAAPNLF